MPSYVITGVSRGIGFAFLENLSSNPANTVIGLVRNKTDTESKIAAWKRPNIHVVQSDVTDYESLKRAVQATSSITGGSLDYLIANAAMLKNLNPAILTQDPLGALGEDPIHLETTLLAYLQTNVVGNIHLFNLFLPLILKSDIKKVISISSGMADLDLVRKYNVHESPLYAISKAAMNMAVGKFSAQYAKDGVTFLSICPGMVDTGHTADTTPEKGAKVMELVGKFQAYAPHFTGPAAPADSVRDVLSVAEKRSVVNGDGGMFVSHLNSKQWL